MIAAPDVVLFLGPADSPLHDWLRRKEPAVRQTEAAIDAQFIDRNGIDFVVSYRYRKILGASVLDRVAGRAVNLHISLLPWNRGADPNLWSFVDDTPKGVTIHYIDDGIDTGDIIAQREIEFGDLEKETLATTYARLDSEIQSLFRQNWAAIRNGRCARRPQSGPGSYHATADRRKLADRLTLGWDTPVADLAARDS